MDALKLGNRLAELPAFLHVFQSCIERTASNAKRQRGDRDSAAIQYSQAGAVQSGGSTLTQQLIKNLTHASQDTTSRKISEAALAIGLTQQYPKWKILEMYFNIAPFGAQDLGIEAAAIGTAHRAFFL